LLVLVGLEADLKHSVAKCVAVQRLDGQNRLLVVCHGDEAEALALVALQIANNLGECHKIYNNYILQKIS